MKKDNVFPFVPAKSEYGTCFVLTPEQTSALFTPDEIKAGIKHGELKTWGMWQLPVSYRAIAVEYGTDKVYGLRTMYHPKQSGYELEGWVSIEGKKRSAFTSSDLCQLPDGTLIDMATICIRSKRA